jgi:hypothetical protein
LHCHKDRGVSDSRQALACTLPTIFSDLRSKYGTAAPPSYATGRASLRLPLRIGAPI